MSADYIVNRLNHHEGTKEFAQWFKATFEPVHTLPRYLIPCYFDAILSGVYNALLTQVFRLMPE